MKDDYAKRPARCRHCSNFMNWSREWDNLWRCGDCGRIVEVGPSKSSRQVVEEALSSAKSRIGRWWRRNLQDCS
jgi:DNA-directed RNA polymerase subunit M/transcription elongation factor TFIIS